ncbi:MAG: hypothetical protein D6733_07815 [Methanobacteriota archaeon]|nr:MAG: hypothetical protein D6733_07815 [Euryarchaeota archaeon]
MEKRWGLLLLTILFISGCIESGSLDLPSGGSKLDLSSISAQLKGRDSEVSSGGMAVPPSMLPGYIVKNDEQGSFSEAFSLRGLPSTTIVWTVYKDPYGAVYDGLKVSATGHMVVPVGAENVTVTVTERDDLYRMAAHIGLYTFVSETEDPGAIDRADIYGDHVEVVKEVFTAGVKNALSHDLRSLS